MRRGLGRIMTHIPRGWLAYCGQCGDWYRAGSYMYHVVFVCQADIGGSG